MNVILHAYATIFSHQINNTQYLDVMHVMRSRACFDVLLIELLLHGTSVTWGDIKVMCGKGRHCSRFVFLSSAHQMESLDKHPRYFLSH